MKLRPAQRGCVSCFDQDQDAPVCGDLSRPVTAQSGSYARRAEVLAALKETGEQKVAGVGEMLTTVLYCELHQHFSVNIVSNACTKQLAHARGGLLGAMTSYDGRGTR